METTNEILLAFLKSLPELIEKNSSKFSSINHYELSRIRDKGFINVPKGDFDSIAEFFVGETKYPVQFSSCLYLESGERLWELEVTVFLNDVGFRSYFKFSKHEGKILVHFPNWFYKQLKGFIHKNNYSYNLGI
jgi:hypothetical protein